MQKRLNSRFDVMRVNVSPFDRPKISFRVSLSSVISSGGGDVSELSRRSPLSFFRFFQVDPALKWIVGFHGLFRTILLYHLRLEV